MPAGNDRQGGRKDFTILVDILPGCRRTVWQAPRSLVMHFSFALQMQYRARLLNRRPQFDRTIAKRGQQGARPHWGAGRTLMADLKAGRVQTNPEDYASNYEFSSGETGDGHHRWDWYHARHHRRHGSLAVPDEAGRHDAGP